MPQNPVTPHPNEYANVGAKNRSMPFDTVPSPKKSKPLVLSIREVIRRKKRGTSAQGKSDFNVSQSAALLKSEKLDQFSFGERSSDGEKGSAQLDQIDDALQDLNDHDRRVNLRSTRGGSPGDRAGQLAVKRHHTDFENYD